MGNQTVIRNTEQKDRTDARQRVLFMPESASLAHLGRLLTLAKSLPESRFSITFACDQQLRRWVPAPFEWKQATSLSSEEFRLRLACGKTLFDAPLLHRQVKEDLSLFHETQPDAVVGDFRPSLAISAPLMGVPYINVVGAHWSPWAEIPFEAVGPLDTWWSRSLGHRMGKALVNALLPIGFRLQARPFNKVRRAYGLSPLPENLRAMYTAGDAVAYTDIPELVPTPGAPTTHHHIGPVLWEPEVPLPSWWTSLPTDRPGVFVSVGSTGRWEDLEKVVSALSRLPVVTLVATSGRGTIRPVPNRVYVADYLPGMETCKKVNLVLCNGGSGTVHQALSAGVPVIGIAANMDQMSVMASVVKQGAGRRIPAGKVSEVNWGKVTQELLTSTEIRTKALALSQAMARTDSAQAFRDLLERTLPSKPLAPSGRALV